MQHGVGVVAGRVEELLQPGARAVVHAVGPQHVQLLQAQVLLHGAQRLHLAPDADEEQALDVQRLHGGEHVEVGRQRRLHAARGDDVLRRARHQRLGGEPVRLIALHADHRLHLPRRQHLQRDLRHDPRPLRTIHRRDILRVQHLFVHPKVEVVHAVEVPGPAMHLLLQRLDSRHAVAQEGAGVLDVRDVVGVAEAALATKLLGGVGAARLNRRGLAAPVVPHGAGADRGGASRPPMSGQCGSAERAAGEGVAGCVGHRRHRGGHSHCPTVLRWPELRTTIYI
mmetsp:Transcript_16344/g.41852  ORF Transcript_16344/g.41852 Transcript_16344/m.41852 type:complete len:283 (+) Transcript_16344:978-1826(+)